MRNAISPCDPPPQSVAYVAVPSVGVLAGVAVTRDIVVEATLSTPCDVLCPSLACFLSVSRCPWRIASQKQKLLLASQFVFLLLLLLFPWCRSVGPPLFYLYSSAVVILLHKRGREGGSRERAHLCPHLWTLASRRRRSWMAFLSFSPFLPKESTPMTSAAFKVPT